LQELLERIDDLAVVCRPAGDEGIPFVCYHLCELGIVGATCNQGSNAGRRILDIRGVKLYQVKAASNSLLAVLAKPE
jgi:hypothetical protein